MRRVEKGKLPKGVIKRESLFFDKNYNDVDKIEDAEIQIVRDLDSKGMVVSETEFLL